jgi:hypothetical protein
MVKIISLLLIAFSSLLLPFETQAGKEPRKKPRTEDDVLQLPRLPRFKELDQHEDSRHPQLPSVRELNLIADGNPPLQRPSPLVPLPFPPAQVIPIDHFISKATAPTHWKTISLVSPSEKIRILEQLNEVMSSKRIARLKLNLLPKENQIWLLKTALTAMNICHRQSAETVWDKTKLRTLGRRTSRILNTLISDTRLIKEVEQLATMGHIHKQRIMNAKTHGQAWALSLSDTEGSRKKTYDGKVWEQLQEHLANIPPIFVQREQDTHKKSRIMDSNEK